MAALNETGALWLITKIKEALRGKVDNVEGKGLSTNDYTTAEKEKLAGIEAGANKTVVNNTLTSDSTAEALSAAQGKALKTQIDGILGDIGEMGGGDMMKAEYDSDGDGTVDDSAALGGHPATYYAPASSVPTKTSDLQNDSNYLQNTGDSSNTTVDFFSAATRVNIATGEKLSVIMGKIAKFFADLKTVAFTGSYNDLTNKPNIPTVTNDLTNELKANYDAAYTHSQSAHAPSNAQANIIESIKVNGAAQAVSGKEVDITVPTTVAQLTDASQYAKKTDLANVYKFKGTVATESELPTSDQIAGDVYSITAVSSYGPAGANVAWTGTAWDSIGGIFEVEAISNEELEAMWGEV